MAEREASGDFDYAWDDPADVDGLTSADGAGDDPFDDDLWDDPDDKFWDDGRPGEHGQFDPFDARTWSFAPAPTPWYRTKQAVTALIAATAAAVAIVVSGVLLVIPGPKSPVDQTGRSQKASPPSEAPTTMASTPNLPPPPPPPPPPPETVASSVATGPDNPPRVQPRQTKEPEIGVTRTPVTRQPISVAPQPRRPRS